MVSQLRYVELELLQTPLEQIPGAGHTPLGA